MGKILKQEGDTVGSQEVIGNMEEGGAAAATREPAAPPAADAAPAAPELCSSRTCCDSKDAVAGPSASVS